MKIFQPALKRLYLYDKLDGVQGDEADLSSKVAFYLCVHLLFLRPGARKGEHKITPPPF